MKLRFLSSFTIALLYLMPSTSFSTDFITTTTENIGKPYQVIDGTCVHSSWNSAMSLTRFAKNQFETVILYAFKEVYKTAKKAKADAFISYDIDVVDGSPEGGVILCGTLVKITGKK